MANREVSIGICGAVVGMLIGAGSVAYGQELSLSLQGDIFSNGLLPLGYKNIELEDAYRRRAINENDRLTRPRANVEDATHGSATEEVEQEPREMTQEEKEACHTKVQIAEELRAIIIPLVPGRPIDQLVRHSMEEAFDAYVATCQPAYNEIQETLEPDYEEEEEVESTIEFIPNYEHCEKFTGGRRTRCIVEERRNNVDYQGGFYQRNDLAQ